MNVILGLGNPGPEYQDTRHNVGFRTLDILAGRYEGRWKKKILRPLSFFASTSEHVVLCKPLTWMNRSGAILPFIIDTWGVLPNNLLVVVDNMDLPPGRIRFKAGGGSAGHNGIKSLMQVWPEGDFPRLYVGVGRPEASVSVVDHVLSGFSAQQQAVVGTAMEAAAQVCTVWNEKGVSAAIEAVHEYSQRTATDN